MQFADKIAYFGLFLAALYLAVALPLLVATWLIGIGCFWISSAIHGPPDAPHIPAP